METHSSEMTLLVWQLVQQQEVTNRIIHQIMQQYGGKDAIGMAAFTAQGKREEPKPKPQAALHRPPEHVSAKWVMHHLGIPSSNFYRNVHKILLHPVLGSGKSPYYRYNEVDALRQVHEKGAHTYSKLVKKLREEHALSATDGIPNAVDGTPNGTDGAANGVDVAANAVNCTPNGADCTSNSVDVAANDIYGTPNGIDGAANGADVVANVTEGTSNGIDCAPNGVEGASNLADVIANAKDGASNRTDCASDGADGTPNFIDGAPSGVDGTPNASNGPPYSPI